MVFVALTMFGCTDATIGKIKVLGSCGKITCYSGGKIIFAGESTGKIRSEKNSDGYFFVNKKTGLMMEVSGDCIITYGVNKDE